MYDQQVYLLYNNVLQFLIYFKAMPNLQFASTRLRGGEYSVVTGRNLAIKKYVKNLSKIV